MAWRSINMWHQPLFFFLVFDSREDPWNVWKIKKVTLNLGLWLALILWKGLTRTTRLQFQIVFGFFWEVVLITVKALNRVRFQKSSIWPCDHVDATEIMSSRSYWVDMMKWISKGSLYDSGSVFECEKTATLQNCFAQRARDEGAGVREMNEKSLDGGICKYVWHSCSLKVTHRPQEFMSNYDVVMMD